MKIYRSYIFNIDRWGIWSEPDRYFISEKEAKKDNAERLEQLEKENPTYWYKGGVDTIEVKE